MGAKPSAQRIAKALYDREERGDTVTTRAVCDPARPVA